MVTQHTGGDEEFERAARAGSRAQRMSVRVVSSLEQDDADSVDQLTPKERMELAAELTRVAWAMTGRPWPDLPRSQWPTVKLPDDVRDLLVVNGWHPDRAFPASPLDPGNGAVRRPRTTPPAPP